MQSPLLIALSLLTCPLLSLEITMLSQAEALSRLYAQEIAKAPPPSTFPLSENCLQEASVWFSIDLKTLQTPANTSPLETLNTDFFWSSLRDLGIDGVRIYPLRELDGLAIDPKSMASWEKIVQNAQKKGIVLIGDLIGNATIAGVDFQEALQKAPPYTDLYQMVEIDPKDWKYLPAPSLGNYETNIPWLTIQELYKLGYVPEKFNPYVKESAWNATVKIQGVDGKMRRWIYLKEGKNRPVLNWLSPSFAAYRLAAGDALEGSFQLGQKILRLDGNIPPFAKEMLSLWIRKIGAFSAETSNGTLEALKNQPSDLTYDTVTKAALLHALIAQDAEALRMIYRLFLEEGIQPKGLIHVLEPFDPFACDWAEFIAQPKKKYRYLEEQITGDVLRRRLLKEDLIQIESSERIEPTTWVDHCARALKIKSFESNLEPLTRAHLLLAFSYAMQPGAFSFSLEDLLGALPSKTTALDLLGPSENTLYSSLPSQLKNPRSFASQLKAILGARQESNISKGELIAVLPSSNPGTLLLLHRLPKGGLFQLLALNFQRNAVQETVERAELSNTSAIDLMSELAEEKVFSSANFSFILPPLSGRAFYFQPKYY